MQDIAEPDDELREERLVEPEPVADQRDLLGVGVVAGDDRRRIARRQAQHQEHEDRDDQHHRHGREQAAQDVAEHRFSSTRRERSVGAADRVERVALYPERARPSPGRALRRTRPLLRTRGGARDTLLISSRCSRSERRHEHAETLLRNAPGRRIGRAGRASATRRRALHGLGDRLLLCRIGFLGEGVAQLLHLGVARPAEGRLVAARVEEAGRRPDRGCRPTTQEVRKAFQPPASAGPSWCGA